MYYLIMRVKITFYLKYIFSSLSLIYLFFAAYNYITRPYAGGDEFLFLNDLILINEQGWIAAIKKNISIPYMLLAYPLTFFVEELFALKIVNAIILASFLVYLYKIENRRNIYLYLYLLFHINASAFFYFGTNDTLFFISLVVFLNEVYNAENKKAYNTKIALSSLLIAIFTRELFVIYLPIILWGLYRIIRLEDFKGKNLAIPCSILLFFLLLNVPSLVENKSLSFDKKSPPESIEASWTQRQYLAQLRVNNGTLNNFQHPSWEETQDYLAENGSHSLPNGVIAGLTHNIPLTLKEFFKDLLYILKYNTRRMGFIFLVVLLFGVLLFIKKKTPNRNMFIPISSWTMTLIFSLIIISYIELRWLAPVFLMAIIYYSDLEKEKKIPKILSQINIVFICLLLIYGTYNLYLSMNI